MANMKTKVWDGGAWMLSAIAEKQQKQKQFKRRDPLAGFSLDDFSVRTRNGRHESYNIRTGEVLYRYPIESFTESEAWADLREEFGGS
jgi:hypothetical protein